MSTLSRKSRFGGLRIKDFAAHEGLGEAPEQVAWRVELTVAPRRPGENIGCLLAIAGGVAGWYYGGRRVLTTLLGAVFAFGAWETLMDRVQRRRSKHIALDADPEGLDEAQRDERLEALRDSPRAPGCHIAALALDENADRVTALVMNDFIGFDASSLNPLRLASHRLPALRRLFVGEFSPDEMELSWMEVKDDLAGVLAEFPELRELRVRGSFKINKTEHQRLETFINEAAQLEAEPLDQLLQCDFPELRELELWMGDPSYGSDLDTDLDMSHFERLWDAPFPNLRRLGLRNSMVTDQLVAELVKSRVIEQLEALDLSLGTLSDEGAELLLKCPAVGRLRRLDIHFHYVSEDNVRRLEALDVELDASHPVPDRDQDFDDDGNPIRYCAVQE